MAQSTDSNLLIGVAASVAAGAVAYIVTKQNTTTKLPLPPSPTGTLPVFGHVLYLNPNAPHLTFSQWAEKYGPLMSVNMGPQTWIVLSDIKTVKEIIEQRSGNFSDRFQNDVFDALGDVHTLGEDGAMFGLARYGDQWRLWRKLTANVINKRKLSIHESDFDRESRFLLSHLLATGQDPAGGDPHDPLYLYVINCLESVLFQRRFESIDHRVTQDILSLAAQFLDVGSQGLVDLFPYFKPLQWNNIRKAKSFQKMAQRTFGDLVEEVRQARLRGEELDCVVNDLLKAQETDGINDASIIQAALGYTMGGMDTITIAFLALISILVNHPEVQDKAFEELKDVVGLARLPEAHDESQLPYISAIMKELLRFRPPTFLGIPHRAREDEVYEGYLIPAKSVVVVNIYHLHFDPAVYKNPHQFDPSRYMEEKSVEDVNRREHWAFGAGRRICPGIMLAEKTLVFMIARLLWSFKISPPLDENGKEVPVPLVKAEGAAFVAVKPAKVRFVPRHGDVKRVVESV